MYKCQGWIGLHLFTGSGADWGEKFVGITKTSCMKAYRALADDHLAIDCFRELDQHFIQNLLANKELPTQDKDVEKFVCQVYWRAGPTTFAKLRGSSFKEWDVCLGRWDAAIMRADIIAMRDESYFTSCPDLPLIKENGWSEYQGTYVFVMRLSLPVLQVAFGLIKCGCKSDCKGRSSCFKNGLFVIALEKSIHKWRRSLWRRRG